MGFVMGTLRPLVLYPYFTPNPQNKESRPVRANRLIMILVLSSTNISVEITASLCSLLMLGWLLYLQFPEIVVVFYRDVASPPQAKKGKEPGALGST